MLFSMLRPFLSDSVRDNVVFHSGDITTIRSYIRYFSYFIQLIKHFKLVEKIFFLLILEDMIRWDPWITSTMCLSSGRWNHSLGKYSSLDIFEENVQMSYWEEWKCSLFFFTLTDCLDHFLTFYFSSFVFSKPIFYLIGKFCHC